MLKFLSWAIAQQQLVVRWVAHPEVVGSRFDLQIGNESRCALEKNTFGAK